MLTYAVLAFVLSDIPPDVASYLKSCEEMRDKVVEECESAAKETQGHIDILNLQVGRTEADLPKIERAEINRASKVIGLNSKSGKYVYQTTSQRADALALARSAISKDRVKLSDLASTLAERNKQVEKFRAVLPMAPLRNASGMGVMSPLTVVQVAGETEFIAEYAGNRFWITMSTHGLVDGKQLRGLTVFKVSGTKTYPTANGSTATVYKAEPIDIKPHLEEWEKRKKN